ncbi:hypothetical protein CHUAL_010062 [Chamberlinius hualienensis]
MSKVGLEGTTNHCEMSFPLTKDEVKTWVWNVLGLDEKKSAEIIAKTVEHHEIDGKLLVLLYKYPHEFVAILPDFRARLLLMNALDVLIKTVGKNIPVSIRTCNMPVASLLSRLTSNKYSEGPNSIKRAETGSDSFSHNHKQHFGLDKRNSSYNYFGDGGSLADANGSSFSHSNKYNHEVGNRDSEIPSPVPLPVFELSLQQAINAGRLRERCIRSRLANACARFYASIKMYPTMIDYHRICEKLVERYPDLKDIESKPGTQPWNQLKKLLSMSFCNVRRIMKVKDLINARHLITSIQKRYKAYGRDRRFGDSVVNSNNNIDSSESSEDEFPSRNKIILPVPTPIPTFDGDLKNAIIEGKLKERPWSSQFYRKCAKFYTKLKPYPSRRDYKNISEHIAKVFPSLGQSSSIKRLLSQYIRSHRQTKKLWKLGQQQKAKMLRIEKLNKSFSASKSGRFKTVDSHSLLSQHDALANYTYLQNINKQSNVNYLHRDDNHSDHSSLYTSHYFSSGDRISPCDSAETKPVLENASTSALQFPVPLPPLDDLMMKGIREGQLQERTLRIRFIRLCANFYISIKNYPTKEDYNNICRTVTTEFPDLRDPSPLPGCPPFMLFKKALTACIRNKRRDSFPFKQSNWLSTKSNSDYIENNYMKTETSNEGSGYYNSSNGITAHSSSSSTTENLDNAKYNRESTMPCFPGQPLRQPILTSLQTRHVNNSASIICPEHAARQLSQSSTSTETFIVGRSDYSHSSISANYLANNSFLEYQIPLPVFPSDISSLLNTGQLPIGENITKCC